MPAADSPEPSHRILLRKEGLNSRAFCICGWQAAEVYPNFRTADHRARLEHLKGEQAKAAASAAANQKLIDAIQSQNVEQAVADEDPADDVEPFDWDKTYWPEWRFTDTDQTLDDGRWDRPYTGPPDEVWEEHQVFGQSVYLNFGRTTEDIEREEEAGERSASEWAWEQEVKSYADDAVREFFPERRRPDADREVPAEIAQPDADHAPNALQESPEGGSLAHVLSSLFLRAAPWFLAVGALLIVLLR